MLSLWICVFILFVRKTSLVINPDVNLMWTNESCIGGERGLLSTGVCITFNASNEEGVVCSTHRQMIAYNTSLPALDSYLENCSSILNITFDFEQPEHGGGLCHCVKIMFNISTSTFK